MAIAIASGQKSDISQGTASCSVCLEVVKDVGERSIAKLACGHYFHLDCIGSAFNVKGTMQCPNCRQVEDGLWLYGNGCHQLENTAVADILNEDEHGSHGQVSDAFVPHDFVNVSHFLWCPYQSLVSQFSESPGNTNHPHTAYMGVQGMPWSVHHGATVVSDHEVGQVVSPPQRQWAQWVPAPSLATNSALELGVLRASDAHRWPRSDAESSQASGRSLHYVNNGRRMVPDETQFANGLFVRYPQEGQMLPGFQNLEFVCTSAVHNATEWGREAWQWDGTVHAQWRQDGWPYAFLLYPVEPEVQRWVLPSLPGSHTFHSFNNSDASTQAGFRVPEAHFFNLFQGPCQAFLAPCVVGCPIINVGSFQPQASMNPSTR